MIRLSYCLLALVVGCASSTLSRASSREDRERIYRSCPGAEVLDRASDVSWTSVESELKAHEAFRARLHLPLPTGPERILIHSLGSHHETVEYSIVAVKQTDDIWRTDMIGELRPGLAAIETERTPHKIFTLSAAESRHVTELLQERCLLANPTFMRNPNIVAGGAYQTLEIESKGERTVLGWFGMLTPQSEELVGLITRG